MQNQDSVIVAQQQRSLMSGTLLARFIFVLTGSVIMFLLPWPYPMWIKIAAVVVWTVQGAVAARSLRGTPTDEEIRRVSRWLLAFDTFVAGIVVYLYLPVYHDVWAFMLLPIVFGATQDRRAAAIFAAAIATIVLAAGYFTPLAPPTEPQRPWTLILDLSVIWLTAVGSEIFLRTIIERSVLAVAESTRNAQAAGAQEVFAAASETQAERLRNVIELVVILMRERELGPLLDRILDTTMQTFGFRCGAILTAERDREVFAYRSVRGYPPDQTRRLMVREVPFAQGQLKMDPRFQVRPSAYYAPVERQSWHTDPLTCYHPEAAMLPRERRGAWHEADTLVFTLTSSSGEILGLLCPDWPVDGCVPSSETLGQVAHFARLAATAIENVYLVSVEPHRDVARRIAQTLDLIAAIFTERNLDALLHRILRAACESFGFNAGTILLREEGRDAYVRRAALGYPKEVEGAEVSGADLRQLMNERARVRETFYYVPMEMDVAGGITRDPSRAILPRVESGQWHENDILLFPIFDSAGSLIGVVTPDDPKDRRVPAYETIQALEVFARIAGLAIETALIRTLAASGRPI